MKNSENHTKAAYITGIFAVIAALIAATVAGLFTLVNSGVLDGEIRIEQPTPTTEPEVFMTQTAVSHEVSVNATTDMLERLYERGKGYMNLGDFVAAKTDLQQVFNASPNYNDVQKLLKEVNDKLVANSLLPTDTPDASNLRNVALNKLARASSNWEGHTSPPEAIDGDLETGWNSATYGGWIEIDLGQEYLVERIELVIRVVPF